ncbi:MAG: 23S rRNA (guanosine(2251)-2'-O)-methyltransferase RlmB [Peptococcaceae bacterium]|nr:23S rRNA (guanosine(2251)-2'-O)-methyltransferase RlmB [Peptococcaceae bacterium]
MGNNYKRAFPSNEQEKIPENILVGINPITEALKGERPIDKILLSQEERGGRLGEIVGMAKEKGIPLIRVNKSKLDSITGDARHQGVMAYVAAHEYSSLEDILSNGGENPLLLLLDEINDPHNLGAILRTAEAAGVDGVVIPKRRSVTLTPTVARISAGAIEHVPVARIVNMSQTIDFLKEQGLWIVGADANGSKNIWESNLDGPLAIVIGGEDKGLGRLISEKCDFLVSLPMMGKINSLNASVAAALIMYEARRQRGCN